MKEKIVALGLFLTVAASAQTNIVFPQLLSPSNAILMTNAEFRTYSGAKILFRNDVGYKSFTAEQLSTNVLIALGTSPEKLTEQQIALDAENKKYRDDVAAYQAELARQKQLKIQQQAAANAAHQKLVEEQKEKNAQNPIYPNVTERESIGVGN